MWVKMKKRQTSQPRRRIAQNPRRKQFQNPRKVEKPASKYRWLARELKAQSPANPWFGTTGQSRIHSDSRLEAHLTA
jgi:hypothetical protein